MTSWSRVLLGELIVAHLVKKSLAFYGTQEPVTGSYPKPDEFIPYFLILFRKFNLILCSHLRLGLEGGLFYPTV